MKQNEALNGGCACLKGGIIDKQYQIKRCEATKRVSKIHRSRVGN